MKCGDTLRFDPDLAGLTPGVQVDPAASPNLHLWIIITEPQPPDFLCIIVNLTSQQVKSDPTVVLHPGEHPYLTKDSVIRFNDALIVDARDLDRFIANRTAKGYDACSAELLKKIQDGVLASRFSSKKVAAFFKERLGVPD